MEQYKNKNLIKAFNSKKLFNEFEVMMIQYPLYFEVSAESLSGIQSSVQGKVKDLPPISCAIPPQFHGPGGGYSPEDLYALAVITCFIATFKVFAEKTQLNYSAIKGTARVTVDRDTRGKAELKGIDLTFVLDGVKDQEQAKKVLAESEKFCLVSNAIKSRKSFNYIFSQL